VNYGVGGVALGSDLRLAQPTVLFAETLVWEVMRSEVERRMGDASRLKRTTYGWARRSAARRGPSGAGRGRHLRAVLGDAALRRKLGLSRVRIGLTGDSELAADTAAFYTGLGVRLVPLPLGDAPASQPVPLADLDHPSSLEETRP
jgi:long-subunit acyl-CoA synthetase (AMP-forming)